MSAWDIAGAVVWTPLAFLLLGAVVIWLRTGAEDPPAEQKGGPTLAIIFGIAALAGAAFSIARLFGAHA